MQLIWGNCSNKMEENCPLDSFFQKKSTDWRMRKLHILTNPKATIQETIYNCHGTDLSPCRREKWSMSREWHETETCWGFLLLCPWVITIIGNLDVNPIDNIPKNVIVPPDTQYSPASVILFNGQHFEGISLDAKNSQGIISFMMGWMNQKKGFKHQDRWCNIYICI